VDSTHVETFDVYIDIDERIRARIIKAPIICYHQGSVYPLIPCFTAPRFRQRSISILNQVFRMCKYWFSRYERYGRLRIRRLHER